MIPKFRINADLKIHKGSSIKDVTTLEGEGLFDLKTFEDTRGRGLKNGDVTTFKAGKGFRTVSARWGLYGIQGFPG